MTSLSNSSSCALVQDPALLEQAAEDILDTMVEEVILGVCFDIHRWGAGLTPGDYHCEMQGHQNWGLGGLSAQLGRQSSHVDRRPC